MVSCKALLEELKTVVSGKTFDALLPPLLFALMNRMVGLDISALVALGAALSTGVIRVISGQAWHYAIVGFLGAGIASAFAYLLRTAASYFIPAAISSAFLVVLALVSLAMGKPLAAWASHLTRGWPLSWFWREDVKPAYREVTWFWAGLFLVRFIIVWNLLLRGNVMELAWANIVLGWPITGLALVVSYIYGFWRLQTLGGPGIDEYQDGKPPPWRGQLRGF